MARREMVILEDDLDGGTADETVSFSLDGVSYEIDLSTANAVKMRDALATYVGGGRRARSSRQGIVTGGPRRQPAGLGRDQNRAIRAWAKQHGKTVSERGRIPASVVEEYEATAGR